MSEQIQLFYRVIIFKNIFSNSEIACDSCFSNKHSESLLTYIKYNVNNKYVTFLLLSFPFPFISIFYSTFGGF